MLSGSIVLEYLKSPLKFYGYLIDYGSVSFFTSLSLSPQVILDCACLIIHPEASSHNCWLLNFPCGKEAMHIIRERHLWLAKFRCQIIGLILMSVMDPHRKRQEYAIIQNYNIVVGLFSFISLYRSKCLERLRGELEIFWAAHREQHLLLILQHLVRGTDNHQMV